MSNLIIEGVKSEIDNGLSNIFGYNFLKTVFSNHQTIQKKRAEEFLEFMKKNEQKFTVDLIKNECFVSGLALTLREVIKEYSNIKRAKIYSIFLGFTDLEDKESFELEKMYNTLNLISVDDLEVLQAFSSKKFKEGDSHFSQKNSVERYSGLISLGIIKSTVEFKEKKGLDFKLSTKLKKEPILVEYTKELNNHFDKVNFTEQIIHYDFTKFGRKFSKYAFSEVEF